MSDSLYRFDEEIREKFGAVNVAGFDEAGRGPLAGPVCSAGCVLPMDYRNDLIDDSKKLTDRKRRILFEEIKKNALAYYIVLVPVEVIDKINILEADRQGMENCLFEIQKSCQVDYIVTDYMKLHTDIPLLSIAKGDHTSMTVAAASILAKVTRDNYMIELDEKYPQYGFKANKGYGTKKHIEAINKYGYIEGVHRLSFEPVRSLASGEKQLTIFDKI